MLNFDLAPWKSTKDGKDGRLRYGRMVDSADHFSTFDLIKSFGRVECHYDRSLMWPLVFESLLDFVVNSLEGGEGAVVFPKAILMPCW